MGVFDIFKKKEPDKKSARVKQKTQSGRQQPVRGTGKKRRIARVKDWRKFPWRRRLLTILGIIGIGVAIWFAIQSSCSPSVTYYLGITINPAGSGSVSPIHGNYSDGARVTLTATPASGYQLNSWSGDATGESPTVTITMDSNKSVTANFRVPQYTLATSVSPPEGGSISPSSGTYDTGSSVTLMVTPSGDYEFVSWSGDATGGSPTVTITMDSNKSVTANFRVPQYTFTLATSVSPPEGGSISPSSGTYDTGSSVTLMVTPSADYEFVSWSGDATGGSPTVTITMDSDKSVTASFVATVQRITHTMPTGISSSVVTCSNVLERDEIVEGFVEITGEFKSYDRDFAWTFEILGPEGRRLEYKRGHWLRDNHYDFSFKAPYSGSYKIRVRHNSLYDKQLVIVIKPKGWQ